MLNRIFLGVKCIVEFFISIKFLSLDVKKRIFILYKKNKTIKLNFTQITMQTKMQNTFKLNKII